ncbi:hypothetical protein FIBSPDRAFT_1046198 [Athelia psychrophila]|uniref:Uncharacterized protein n=1 Tax=Athelia psychrophila TaxID=1759441 RepID=A0A166H5U3_9AGAM|nr:hypothetical protein FIBSPDRAFT_1046198 [Fibularhizoctonia sp. CBS 109695]
MQGSEARPLEGAKLTKFRRIISQLKPPIIHRRNSQIFPRLSSAPQIDILLESTPSKARRIMTRIRDKLPKKYKPAAILAEISPSQGAGGILGGNIDVQTQADSNQEETRTLTSSAANETAAGPIPSDDVFGQRPFQSNLPEPQQTFHTHHTSGGHITNVNGDYTNVTHHHYHYNKPCGHMVSAVDGVTVPKTSLLEIAANGDITIVMKMYQFAILFS